jgi:predicted transcriptional regulator
MDGLIKLITSSKKRVDIIIELSKNPCTLADLSRTLNSKPPNVVAQLKKLESEGIIESKGGRRYGLSEFGRLVYEVMVGFRMSMKIIKKHDMFWKSHDISSIPEHLLRRIGELGQCSVIQNPSEYIYEIHEDVVSNIILSNKIWGIYSVYHPKYPKLFSKLVSDGKSLNLIITKSLFKKLAEEIPDKLHDMTIYIIEENIKLSMMVSDKFLCLVLYSKAGQYDTEKFLISFDKTALNWGIDLYNYYKEKSERVITSS